MPKVNLGLSPRERELREQLKEDYGMYLSISNVKKVLSTDNRDTVVDWLEDVPYITIGAGKLRPRRRYAADAIARKLARLEAGV